MKKWMWIGIGIIGSIIVLLTASYIALAFYYSNTFPVQTCMNDIYATGKTIEQINEELTLAEVSTREIPTFEIYTAEGVEVITGETMEYAYDFTNQLQQWMENYNPFTWGLFFLKKEENIPLEPDVVYEEDLLSQEIDKLNCFKTRGEDDSYLVEIITTDNGYELNNERQSVLDLEKARDVILKEVKAGNTNIDFVEQDCYQELSYSRKDKEILELWKQIDAFQQYDLTYLFGEDKEVVSVQECSQWILKSEPNEEILLDDNGKLMIDETKVNEFIENLAAKYDTYHHHVFTMRNGEEVIIKGGEYGNKINQKVEIKWLLENIQTREFTVREPVYSKEEEYKGENDLGSAYIEIDLADQKLYYVVDGEDVLETDIVTGNVRGGMGTPAMVCAVYGKQKNRTLVGATYRSFVYYWMPVYKGIGIHDATWRDEFGGDIYLTGGSHGCINLPLEKVEVLYDMVSIGTPVVIY